MTKVGGAAYENENPERAYGCWIPDFNPESGFGIPEIVSWNFLEGMDTKNWAGEKGSRHLYHLYGCFQK